MGVILETINSHNPCWYTRFQGILFLLVFLTFGLGDAITSIYMVEKRGIMVEANPFARYVMMTYGTSIFFAIKIWFTAFVILFIPYLIQIRSKRPIFWMLDGYLISFITEGIISIFLNLQAMKNENLLFPPEHVLVIFFIMVLILTSIGEEIDRRMPVKIDYLECALHDLAPLLLFIFDKSKN
jgi:hypothetical protein